jgi:hypothetical protein
MTEYHVEQLDRSNLDDWERLNEKSQDGGFYHTMQWKKVLERSFGGDSMYLIAYEGSEPVALCPLFKHSRKGLKALGPPPATDSGNIVVEGAEKNDLMRAIIKTTASLARENRCAYLILKSIKLEAFETLRDACMEKYRNTFPYPVDGELVLDLEQFPPSKIWDDVFNSRDSQRKYIRRFEKAGFQFREANSTKDLDTFYQYYSANLEHIGVKPFDREHFDILHDECRHQDIRVNLLEREGEVAGGILALLHPQTGNMYLRYMALNRKIQSTYHPPFAMYWEAINYAFEQGYRKVHFGTNTKDDKDISYHIKKGFGCHYVDHYADLVPLNRVYAMVNNLYLAFNRVRGPSP